MPTRADYAKIHIALKDLGIDDETYRSILNFKFRVKSAKDLTKRQVTVLLNHFKAKGWQPKAPKKTKTKKMANDPQSRKIRALWLTLHQEGVVKNPSELALGKYVKRITGVSHLKWCSPAQKGRVIETLKKWQARCQMQDADLAAKL